MLSLCRRVRNTDSELGRVAHARNLDSREASIGRSQVPGQPGLHSMTVFQMLRVRSWENSSVDKVLAV